MTLSLDVIIRFIEQFLWPLCRIGAMTMVMTGFGAKMVPEKVKILYAIAITLALMPVLPAMPTIELFSVTGFLITIVQILIGVLIGLISQFVIQTFVVAGQIVAMQTSLGFSSMVDPLNGQSSPVVGQFFLILATLMFLMTDGHLFMLQLIAHSFVTFPVSEDFIPPLTFRDVCYFVALMFQAALMVSLSAIVALLTVNLSFGVMTKAAPQLNIFSVGFSVGMILGLFILWFTISDFSRHYTNHWQDAQRQMCRVVQMQCG